ncbi:aminotransferase class V [Kribbella flavida DSM 17836]|uniref:cysteine desulfurase n=1 Tax=Kribbella flavida (strain DSM 17836 / JCM 10339 / NBRC 14399) TaxID=479435 RepID=D2Q1X9_KRIFD|nr:cysteine desulfurase family protein [Kribbella flavida]ADB33925.1 aminotransferase class V [Kribbella flavida DSM 17836]
MTPTPRRTVYLDHAATTPMLPAAIEAMTHHLARTGNASSLHGSGRAARRTVEESRETIAAALNAQPSEVVFTSGGTEADNLALKGLWWARLRDDPRRRRILLSGIEHHAVLDPAVWLAQHEGAELEWLPVDQLGRVRPEQVRAAIDQDPASVSFVTLMMANNEVGTLQPVEQVAAIAAEYGIPVHTDAVQAIGQVPVDFAALGVDAMTVSAHKLGGPYGIGALVVHKETQLVPVLHGGGQERDVRSGTLDTPATAGFAVAVEHAIKDQAEEAGRLTALRDQLVQGVTGTVPGAELSGDPVDRLPGNAHLSFKDCEGDSLLLLLDARGIEVSTGSACNAGVAEPSHVLLAMGYDDQRARGSLRFTLGHTSSQADVDAVLEHIGPVVERAMSAGLQNVGRNN